MARINAQTNERNEGRPLGLGHTSGASALAALRSRGQARWAQLAPRERRGLLLAAALCALGLLWGVFLAPAWRSLAKLPAQQSAAQAQLHTMQRLQARAQALQQRSPLAQPEALATLQKSAAALGTGAKLTVLGEQATLTLQAVSAQNLAQWLAQPRTLAPVQAHLQRSAGNALAWDGQLVFQLPTAGVR